MLLSYPVAPEGYLDDFSYAKTALEFVHTGGPVYNSWASPMMGWLIVWGGLFIKLFGFSFTVLRFAALPLAMASIYLLHRILTGLGISERNASIGALTLGLSPQFFPLEISFMTDMPGMFVLLLCTYMCLRAVAASSDRATAIWLVSAALASLAGGTVRQTSWLGVLVVPSTAWYLRRRRGALVAGLLSAAVSAIGVLACLRWFARQPNIFADWSTQVGLGFYVQPEILGRFLRYAAALPFDLLLILLPIVMGWLPPWQTWSRRIAISVAGAMTAAAGLIEWIATRYPIDTLLMPWNVTSATCYGHAAIYQASSTPEVTSTWLGIPITVVILAIGAGAAMTAKSKVAGRSRGVVRENRASFEISFWLFIPVCLAYGALLVPRASMQLLYDRYLLQFVVALIVLLLLAYQRWIGESLPWASLGVLALFGMFSIGATHDFYATERATDRMVQALAEAGVPRTSISQSFNSDAWLQLEREGRMNMPGHPSPSMANKPPAQQFVTPTSFCSVFMTPYTPAITPRYYLVTVRSACLAPTQYPAVNYRAWIPPLHRKVTVQQ